LGPKLDQKFYICLFFAIYAKRKDTEPEPLVSN
jgi:hypothetical protein